MPTKVRIIIATDDQVRSYQPSPDELHHFVPTGELIAQVSRRHNGGAYRVYHADTETVTNHPAYADAVLATLRL